MADLGRAVCIKGLGVKEIIAIVKPFRAQAVIEAVIELGISDVVVREAKGYGRQKDRLPEYLGSEYNLVYLPKIEIRLLAEDDQVERVTARIVELSRTGRIGDGKIMVTPVLGGIEF